MIRVGMLKNSGLKLATVSRCLFSTYRVTLQETGKNLPEILTTEDTSDLPKEIISGAPTDLSTKRIVRIYQESKSATQSGAHNRLFWKIDWDIYGKGNRWENDLIGYQGSSDVMQGTRMNFDNREAAIRFSKGQGWDYYVQEPKERKFRKKEYAVNFLHSPDKLKHIRTK